MCARRIHKSACASAQSDQNLRCHMKKLCILGSPKCAQWRIWSDCANAQSDLNLRWAHMSKGTFSDVTAYVVSLQSSKTGYRRTSVWKYQNKNKKLKGMLFTHSRHRDHLLFVPFSLEPCTVLSFRLILTLFGALGGVFCDCNHSCVSPYLYSFRACTRRTYTFPSALVIQWKHLLLRYVHCSLTSFSERNGIYVSPTRF